MGNTSTYCEIKRRIMKSGKFRREPRCFGRQDEIKIPCSPNGLGGKGKTCKFERECLEKTFEGWS
jgi:hypothetical protein